ncbi:MAG: N-acetyltransferase family protein [Acidimicrobiia bacterium]
MPRRRASASESRQDPESDRAEPVVAEQARIHVLRDGHRILVRPLLPVDRAQMAERYAELSPSSRRSRFGTAPDELSPHQLDQLVDLDYDDRFALGAVAVDEPGEPGVGVARYARDSDDPTAAEAAVIVIDAYQHRGIGSLLLWDLIAVARAHGITTFTATVMWESAELLDAVRCAGATVEPAEPGVAAVRFQLPDEGPTLDEVDAGSPERLRHWWEWYPRSTPSPPQR